MSHRARRGILSPSSLLRRPAQRRLTFEPLEPRELLSGQSAASGFATADLNRDGAVDALDRAILSENWGRGAGAGDINGDGLVDVSDLNLLAAQWNTSGSGAGLPSQVAGNVRFWLDSTDAASIDRRAAAMFTAANGRFLSTPDAADLRFGSQMTIAFYVNQTTLGENRTLLAKWDDPATGSWSVSTGPTTAERDELRVAVGSDTADGSVTYATTVGANLVPDTWYHVVVVYDGTQASNPGRLRIYVNGVREVVKYSDPIDSFLSADVNEDNFIDVSDINAITSNWLHPGWGDINLDGIVDVSDLQMIATQWLQVPPPPVASPNAIPAQLRPSAADLYVGKQGGASSRFFDGALDEVGLWSRALSPAELQQLYNQGDDQRFAQLTAAHKVGLAAWWDLDELAGQTRADAVAGHNLLDTTGVGRRETVASWTDQSAGQVQLSQGYPGRPDYLANAIDGKPAVAFNGQSNLLRSPIPGFASDGTGNVFLVVKFPEDTNFSQFNTIFSTSDENNATRYLFFQAYPIDSATGQFSHDGAPRFRIRWRFDNQNDDVRGDTIIQPGGTYIVNIWADGPGTGYHMRVNGVDQTFTTTSPQPQIEGSWYNTIPGLNYATLGALERSDGREDFGRVQIGEVLVFGPNLSTSDNRAVEQYLAQKWGVALSGGA
ncbi:MAG: hypothetical protein HYX69_18345 [Planctomycetia bacterium]|nr:hypothetical protein [Planctomycetia bacterium]